MKLDFKITTSILSKSEGVFQIQKSNLPRDPTQTRMMGEGSTPNRAGRLKECTALRSEAWSVLRISNDLPPTLAFRS